MRTISIRTTTSIRTVVLGTLALVSLAAAAAGQTAPSPVLNAHEVRALASSTDPADHARLSAHFAALADRYQADAKRHNNMAGAFIAAPTRRVGANSASDHCRRLAALNTRSAETLRELAAYHETLAAGTASPLPEGAERFHSGTGAPEPSDDELGALAARATAPADHRALQEYFLSIAKRYTATAKEHVAMAQAYRGTRIAQAAGHCDRLVTLSREEAKRATAAAQVHAELAEVVR